MSDTQTAAAGRQNQEQATDDKWHDAEPGHVLGNLTEDPALRFTGTGRPVCNLRVASSSRVQDAATSEWRDGPAEFHNVVVWGTQGERVAQCLQRGDRIIAIGRWQWRMWENREGEMVRRVQLLSRDIGASMLFRPVRILRSAG